MNNAPAADHARSAVSAVYPGPARPMPRGTHPVSDVSVAAGVGSIPDLERRLALVLSLAPPDTGPAAVLSHRPLQLRTPGARVTGRAVKCHRSCREGGGDGVTETRESPLRRVQGMTLRIGNAQTLDRLLRRHRLPDNLLFYCCDTRLVVNTRIVDAAGMRLGDMTGWTVARTDAII